MLQRLKNTQILLNKSSRSYFSFPHFLLLFQTNVIFGISPNNSLNFVTAGWIGCWMGDPLFSNFLGNTPMPKEPFWQYFDKLQKALMQKQQRKKDGDQQRKKRAKLIHILYCRRLKNQTDVKYVVWLFLSAQIFP